jgi:hypothetical protein
MPGGSLKEQMPLAGVQEVYQFILISYQSVQ